MKEIIQSKIVKGLFFVLFIVYLLIVIQLIIVKYHEYRELPYFIQNISFETIREGLKTGNLKPFYTINMYKNLIDIDSSYGWDKFVNNIINNVIALIPYGLLLPFVLPEKHKLKVVFITGFLFVLGLEFTQLATGIGVFDVDDILLNVIGVLLGMVLYIIVTFIIYNTRLNNLFVKD